MGVLVIDPEETSRKSVCEALKWADRRYAIKIATDGSGSWPLALQWRPRLVICETVLPDIDGTTLCQQLKGRLSRTIFVAYTADPATLRRDFNQIFQGVLCKPASRLEILPFLQAAKMAQRRSNGSVVRQSRKPPEPSFETIDVNICIDNELTFKILLPNFSTIATALEKINRQDHGYRVIRDELEVTAGVGTALMNGDRVYLTTAVPKVLLQ